jgi:hypothetical protein
MYPHLANGEGGELGESGLDQARRMQMEGVARPDPRFEQATRHPSPGSPAFDPARYQGAAELDPAGLREFGAAAKELGLSHDVGTRLLQMHSKAMSAQRDALETQWNSWYRETELHFGDRLPEVVADIKAGAGSDGDAQRFYELLEWSGLAFEPAVLRTLHRLAGGGRRY